MSLSVNTTRRMFEAVTNEVLYGPEVVDAINQGQNLAQQSGWSIPAAIVAAHVSTTTDFGALKVGDLVAHIPAVAGNSIFYTVATAGTLPAAAVVGDLYVVLRAYALPATVAGVIKL
jgi:hypothetical protein